MNFQVRVKIISISTISLAVRLSERSPFDGSCCGGYTGDDTSTDSEPPPPPRYRIVLLGDAATGKTGEIELKRMNYLCHQLES